MAARSCEGLMVCSMNTSSGCLNMCSCCAVGACARSSSPEDEACKGSRPANPGDVDDGPERRETLDEQHLVAFHDTQGMCWPTLPNDATARS